MGIGGRIPPLLEALALLFRRILLWSDFLVISPQILSQARCAGGFPAGVVGSPHHDYFRQRL